MFNKNKKKDAPIHEKDEMIEEPLSSSIAPS